MKIVKKILITEEEEKHLQWIIDWYNDHDNMLQECGINVEEDLYEIIADILLDGEVSEEGEDD